MHWIGSPTLPGRAGAQCTDAARKGWCTGWAGALEGGSWAEKLISENIVQQIDGRAVARGFSPELPCATRLLQI